MDNLITSNIANIAYHASSDRFTFIKHDVTEYIYLPGEVNYVLHFTSPASLVDYLRFPIQTLKVGSLGTYKALGFAKEKGAKFLLASTSEVYGDPLVNPQKEEYCGNVNPVGPRGAYDEAKRFAEALTMAYHQIHKLDTKIARIFNTYGPRMRADDGRVISNFINQVINNQPLTVYGDGSQTMSFCYVSDMVEGIYGLMLSDINEPINLGNPEEITIIKLAQMILGLAGSHSGMTFKPLPPNDPKVRQPDINRARKLLGWEPKVSFIEGLKSTLAYFKGSQIATQWSDSICRAN